MVDTVDWRARMANLVYGAPYEPRDKGATKSKVDTSSPPSPSQIPSNLKDRLSVLFANVPEPDAPDN